ncbi:hypothetical protein BCF55_1777 [Hydrogenivirga caldilitoris]|uniref:Uncharacterized protein n=1 Tax=Hydrogenivirga caldilitoris TaxID=246264 RepID=A0A497XR63_9AQUI|nr:hypothetical protein [Hydrogenivirga caldilitoris]RLJ71475.1 hypothetical protein BCF55_1777 [Hydrogenivirga caldilitoris]
MRNIFMPILLLLFLIPGFVTGKKKETYIAKTKNNVKHSKRVKSRTYIRKYPVKSNTAKSGEELKLQEIVKDIYE